jgi:hypothetical protein
MKYYKNAALLQSDLWIICDGPVHQSGKNKFILVSVETHISTSLFMLQKTFTQWTLWKLGTKSCNDASAIISFNEDDDGRVTKGFDDVFH